MKALDGLATDIRNGKIELVKSLNSWLDELDQRNCSPQTQRVYFVSVKKFVEVILSDLEFKWKRGICRQPTGLRRTDFNKKKEC